jgi:hypothetical protein
MTARRKIYAEDGESSSPEIQPATVPFMITNAQKAALTRRGYSREEIREMKPADALEEIVEGNP